MKFLFDLLPVIVFFVAYKVAGIYAGKDENIYYATAVAIAVSVAQIGWMLIRRRKVEPIMWASFAIIVVFGGATLFWHNDDFIKWKPTVLYWMFAGALLGGKLFFRRNLIKAMMGKQIAAPEPVWEKLNISWIAFFSVLGMVNLFVAFYPFFGSAKLFSRDDWVNFKVFGAMGMMIAFVIVQALWLSRHIQEKEETS
jgi:intracellular septation protein